MAIVDAGAHVGDDRAAGLDEPPDRRGLLRGNRLRHREEEHFEPALIERALLQHAAGEIAEVMPVLVDQARPCQVGILRAVELAAILDAPRER